MIKSFRIRRSLVLAASLGAVAVAAPAAQAVEVKVVERPRGDELFVTARTNVNDSLTVGQLSQDLMRVRSNGSDTITLPAGSGCRYLDTTRRFVQCSNGPEVDSWDRANVKTGDRADVLNVSAGSALVDLGSGDDAATGAAIFGGTFQLAIFGKTGNDVITDTSPGGRSALVVGNEGNDVLRGGASNTRIEGGLGVDEIDAGAGADTILVARDNNASDLVTCGDAFDTVEADFVDRLSVTCEQVSRI